MWLSARRNGGVPREASGSTPINRAPVASVADWIISCNQDSRRNWISVPFHIIGAYDAVDDANFRFERPVQVCQDPGQPDCRVQRCESW